MKPKNKIERVRERPHPLDEGMTEKVCTLLSQGVSLREICKDTELPAQSTIYEVMAINDAYRSSIARAREMQQEAIMEDTIALADSATPETVHVIKLRIWARQWLAAKLAPKKYGERIGVDLDVTTQRKDISELFGGLDGEKEG